MELKNTFFADCKTVEDVKKKYKELARKFHPDLNPNDKEAAAKMKMLNKQFDEINWNKFSSSADNSETGVKYEDVKNVAAEYRKIIESLAGCEEINIDIVGTWVWLTGNTFKYKDKIKELGFRWASKKKAWYWHKVEDSVVNHSRMTLDEIKEKYGCKSYSMSSHKLIPEM